MPVRLLWPTLRTSERWQRARYFDRCFYISLLNLVDDYGRYEANPALLASECFPYGGEDGLPITSSAIDGALRSLASKDLLVVYRNDGKQFLELRRFRERKRSKSKWPGPETSEIVWKSEDCCQLTAVASKCPQVLASPSPSPSPSPTVHTHPPTPLNVEKSVRVNLKEMIPDKRLVIEGNGALDLMQRLNGLYHRPENDPWTYEEQHLCASIAKRPNWITEWDTIIGYRYKLREKRYFPQSIIALLSGWTVQLDKSRTAKKNPSLVGGAK